MRYIPTESQEESPEIKQHKIYKQLESKHFIGDGKHKMEKRLLQEIKINDYEEEEAYNDYEIPVMH